MQMFGREFTNAFWLVVSMATHFVVKQIYDTNGRYESILNIAIKTQWNTLTMSDDEDEMGEEENGNNLGVWNILIFIFHIMFF